MVQKVLIIVFADTHAPTYLYDGALAMGNLMNAANALGVDSCWIHRAKEVFETEYGKELKNKWAIPESYEGIGHCILGYRDESLKSVLKERLRWFMHNIRIGQAVDIHQLVEGRKLILGGVEIEHSKGLLGHSDADVYHMRLAKVF